MFSRFTLKSVLLIFGLLMVPVFGYLMWSASDTLETVTTQYGGVGGGVKQDFQSIPTLPLTEEQDAFTLTDNTSDGIDIQFANQTEASSLVETPKLNLSFPKDYSQPIEVKLDDKRTVSITDLSGKSDYSVETLGQEAFRTQPENTSFFQKLFPKTDKTPQTYLRYTSNDDRKSLLYAYQKDQASGEKKLKHWTLYEQGDGIEQESYKIGNVKVKINADGVVEVFYYTEQDLKNDQVAAEVDTNLMARAQRTLAKEMGDDLLSGSHTPDFTIPKPYYIDAQGEKHEAEWKWSEENATLSVSFSPTSYPVALDPTLSFTAPGSSTSGSVITGEPSGGIGSGFGVSMASGDFNADGKTDLAVGATTYGLTYEGRVYIFYNDSSFAQIANGADAVIHDSVGYTRFGTAVAAGDVNGDGRTDLIASTDLYDNTSTGAVKIFYNDGVYPSTTASADVSIAGEASTNFGSALKTGDFNADGKVDIVVGAPRYSSVTGRAYIFYNDGSIPTTAGTADVFINGNAANDSFGSSFAAGDVNSDGKTDLIVGAYTYSSSIGRAYIFYNDGSIPTAAGSADVTITGENASDAFGAALTTGDFDADGKVDLASSSPVYSSYAGRVYIFYGDGSIPTTAATADVKITTSYSLDEFGRSLVAGDMNGDGRTDLVASAGSYFNSTGRTYIFYNDGSIPTVTASADVTITGEGGGYFGSSLATGDFNVDGKTDVAVGANYAAGNAGRAYIFYSQNGQVSTNRLITGESSVDNFSWPMTTGDWNADGRIDLAVSAYGYSAAGDTGRVYIFYGDGQIPTTAATADIIITGNASGDRFGYAITAGDYNADGRADLAVGAPQYSTSTGRAYIFYGGSIITEGASGADVTITGETTSNNFGITLATGDWNADGTSDLAVSASGYDSPGTDTGRVYIFNNDGSIPTTAATADVTLNGETSSSFGVIIVAGDFNASGTTDLAVTDFNAFGRLYIFYNDGSYPAGASTADVKITGENSGDFFGVGGLTPGDFNADGKTDIAVGSSAYSSNTGRAYIFYADGTNNFGTATCSGSSPTACLAADADVKINGETTSNEFGAMTAGDMNADGRTDLIVGAYRYGSYDGRAYIFYNDGSYSTSASNADVTLGGDVSAGSYYGYALAIGDISGDGRVDLIVGARGYNTGQGRVYFYETRENFAWQIQKQPTSSGITRTSLGGSGQEIQISGEAGTNFGWNVTSGDFNADGKADLAVGALSYSSGTGRAYIFYGDGSMATGASSADVVITGETTSTSFGGALTSGDLNADGKTDLVVAGQGYNSSNGRVYVFYNDGTYPSSAGSADAIMTGEGTDVFGVTLKTGDLNADGKTDLVVSATRYTNDFTGRVYIFYSGSITTENASGADVKITGEATGDTFGTSLAVGDFNTDGEVDLAVGANGYSSAAGRAYIFYNDGSIPTTAGTADIILTSPSSYFNFGVALASGDFNADGRTDLAVGSHEASYTNIGHVYIFYNDGSMPTTSGTADVTLAGDSGYYGYFGYTLTSGDWNSDGKTDLAVGAPGTTAGSVYIFNNDGSYPAGATTADLTLTGEGSSDQFGYALTSGDWSGDGKLDLAVGAAYAFSNRGRVYTYSFNDPVITGGTTNNQFGYAMTTGDYNADGQTDLAVGAYAFSSNAGRAYVFYNDGQIPSAVASADAIITGAASSYFGQALASGDFNFDGKVDLAVGGYGCSSFAGCAYIFYNGSIITESASGADVTITGESSSFFGNALVAGDFNADGRTDLAGGAEGYSATTGRAYVFYNDGSIPTAAGSADAMMTGEAGSNNFGAAMGAGDVNGDGKVDFIVGARNYSSAGRAYIFYNGSITTENGSSADVLITGESGSNFGVSFAASDFNFDGKGDLAVGATGYSSAAGRAYIFYGDGFLPTTAATADITIDGESSSSFGVAMTAGDWNADGRADLAVGASAYTTNTGRVYTFYNDGAFPTTAATADMIQVGATTNNYFGFALASGDINSDGKNDLIVGARGYTTNTGRVYIFSSEVSATSVLPGTFYMKGTGKLKGTGTIK